MPGRFARAALSAAVIFMLSATVATAAQVELFTVLPSFSPYNVAGRSATIKGIGFTASSTVNFDGVAATTIFIDSRTLVAIIPTAVAAQVGTVHVSDPVNGDSEFFPFFYTGPVLYVSTTGADGNAGTDPLLPKQHLWAAFAAVDAVTPTEIRVEEGQYVESQLRLLNASILSCGWATGFSFRDPDVRVTEINGGRGGFVIRTSGLQNVSAIDGCTIADGLQDGFGGGGVAVSADNTIINNSVISGNVSTITGGGIYWKASSAYGGIPNFSFNVIVGNRAFNKNGGGIGIYANYNTQEVVDVTVTGNHIVGNRSFKGRGGGVSLSTGSYAGYNTGTIRLTDNVISHNSAKIGGGVDSTTYTFGDFYDFTLFNNLINSNTAQGAGGGISFDGLGTHTGSVISNTVADNASGPFQGGGFTIGNVTLDTGFTASDLILWNNFGGDAAGQAIGAITYSLAGTALPGTGNISADPVFVPGQLSEHYLRQSDPNLPDSPAVDAGSTTAVDLSLEPLTTRTDNVTDTGVDDLGYHSLLSIQPSPNPIAVNRVDPATGDINGNDWVLVRGDGFDPGAEVFFDSVLVQEQIYLGHKRILAKPAPHTESFVTVRVINPDATTDTVTSGYVYLDNTAPAWTSTVGIISATGSLDACQRAVLLDWGEAVDLDSPPVVFEVYREECLPPLSTGTPCENFGYIPNATNFQGTTTQTYYVDNNIGVSGQPLEWLYNVRARDSANFFTNKEWNFGKRLALGDSGGTEIPPDEVGDTFRPVWDTPDQFTWSPPTGAIDYGFYRTNDASTYADPNTVPLLITLNTTNNDGDADGLTDTTYTDSASPVPGEAFYYKVSAIDHCGGETLSEILP
jgi:hypothetical protein